MPQCTLASTRALASQRQPWQSKPFSAVSSAQVLPCVLTQWSLSEGQTVRATD